jgi:hypothetical protein
MENKILIFTLLFNINWRQNPEQPKLTMTHCTQFILTNFFIPFSLYNNIFLLKYHISYSFSFNYDYDDEDEWVIKKCFKYFCSALV